MLQDPGVNKQEVMYTLVLTRGTGDAEILSPGTGAGGFQQSCSAAGASPCQHPLGAAGFWGCAAVGTLQSIQLNQQGTAGGTRGYLGSATRAQRTREAGEALGSDGKKSGLERRLEHLEQLKAQPGRSSQFCCA